MRKNKNSMFKDIELYKITAQNEKKKQFEWI